MSIHIDALTFSTIIGILDFERVTPQEIIINAKIDYCYKENDFINYAEIIELIQNRCTQEKYGLLEDALKDITKNIIQKYQGIKEIYFKITKPDIIKNAKVSLSITIKN
jgi:dihydroneopterin aldolase